MAEAGRRFLPQRVPIDGLGAGGFRFGDMSHRGSLLCLPSGMHAWGIGTVREIDEASLAPVFEEAEEIDILLIGTGRDPMALPQTLRWRLRDMRISADAMTTSAATMTWNVLLAENRRVAAALLAVP